MSDSFQKSTLKKAEKAFSANRHIMLIVIIAIIWGVFQITTKGLFLSSRNLGTLFLQFSLIGYVSIGAVVVMITRGIDLSVTSVVCVVAAVGAVLNVESGLNPVATLGIMLVLSLGIGAIYGGIVSKFGIPAFVATLAGQMTFQGVSLLISKGQEHAPMDESITSFATTWIPPMYSLIIVVVISAILIFIRLRKNNEAAKLGLEKNDTNKKITTLLPIIFGAVFLIYVSRYRGFPIMFVTLIVWAVAVHIVLSYTTLGRHIYAVGNNPEGARLNGINPKKILFLSFIFMGFAYFLASVGATARITGYAPSIATDIQMDAISACVIGGTGLLGGTGSVIGAVLGTVLLSSIDNGMVLMNVSSYWQYTIKGLILLVAVIIDIRAQKNK